ncbi:MAG: CAP domain-containing protein [Oculatellaceae cyanobacterium bins.114]|nr:CAP domain-containing protein [Oculatellaceae cyanobacterium bins.114]
MSVEIFVDSNFSGATSGVLEQGYSYIGDFWNDQISSIKVYSGTWEFFEHANFEGRSFQLTPGEYPWVTEVWNDLISSFKPVEQGTPSELSIGGMAQEILNAHNAYRSQVGVPPLQWSDSLAASAQQWANQLAATGTFEHSGAGENLAQGSAGGFSVTQLVDMWGSEKQYFVYGTFPNISSSGNWSDVGHYTQLIWRNTTEVGCGLASGNGNDVLVCHYNPAGNVEGQAVF